MSTKITHNEITDTLDEMGYDPNTCTEVISLDIDIFNDLALIAHENDITVNALVNAIFHNKMKEMGAFDPPSIPGVGSAPYMEDWKD